jgi:hypothetical protein
MCAAVLSLATSLGHTQQAALLTDTRMSSDQFAAKNITPPELIRGDSAEYPVEAKFQQISGLCSISLEVGIQGDPQNIHIIHCTDPSFEETSLNAVEQYKFKPAATPDGKPVLVTMPVILRYHVVKHSLSLRMVFNWPINNWPIIPDKRLNLDRHMGKTEANLEVSKPIRSAFIPLRGGVSEPDSDGVYSLTRNATGPRVVKFSDKGYGQLAFVNEGNSVCDVVLTIDLKGRASDPQVMHCERPELEKPAIDSLLKSEYKPGFVKGNAVPMRASIHLEYGEVNAK